MTGVTLVVVVTLNGNDSNTQGAALVQLANEGRLEPGFLNVIREELATHNAPGDWCVSWATVHVREVHNRGAQ